MGQWCSGTRRDDVRWHRRAFTGALVSIEQIKWVASLACIVLISWVFAARKHKIDIILLCLGTTCLVKNRTPDVTLYVSLLNKYRLCVCCRCPLWQNMLGGRKWLDTVQFLLANCAWQISKRFYCSKLVSKQYFQGEIYTAETQSR